MIGFDTSREIAAYQWRAQLNRMHSLQSGDIVAYKNYKFQEQIMQKYAKKDNNQ